MLPSCKKSLLLIGSLMLSSAANAEYRDALTLPSLIKPTAQTSLVLDIDRTQKGLVAVGERGHILLSKDQGASWQQVMAPTRMQLNAVDMHNNGNGFAVGEDEVIIKTTDYGQSWTMQHNGIETEEFGPLLDVLFINDQTGFTVGAFNKIYRTDDAGQSWELWQDNIDNLDEWHLISLAKTNGERPNIYISSEMGLIFKSTDLGQNFEAVQTDHDGSFHGILARTNAQGIDELVLMGVGGIVYTTTDGGDSWNQIDTQTEDGLSSGIWLDDGSALLSGANGTLVHINKSLDAAQKHQTAAGLPLSSALQIDNERVIVVGFGGFDQFTVNTKSGQEK